MIKTLHNLILYIASVLGYLGLVLDIASLDFMGFPVTLNVIYQGASYFSCDIVACSERVELITCDMRLLCKAM